GRYTITASRFGGLSGTSQGSFVLTVNTAPTSGLGLSPDAALFIRYGDSLAGSIDDEHSFHYYTFGAQRGDIVTISLERATGTLDPFMLLLNTQRSVIQEDDDSGSGRNALMQSFSIPETGNYYILATRYEREAGDTSGDYVLRLEGVTGEAPIVAPGTLTILYNSSVNGEISNATPSTAYAFLAHAGDVITVEMTARGGDLDPLLLLFDTDSVQLAADDDSGPGQDARIANFTIPADGTYYIIATRYEFQSGTTSGSYSLSLTPQTPTAEPDS
ncbi:MAG: pre-peptidase C-terminal domain-containing protein, partial [Anaerolineae bacterium]|nr:pre-peptidase C-terminal domain-containing protein [Anaerolineae bacterium]